MSKISDRRLRSSLTLWTMLFAFAPLTANAQGTSPVTPGVGSILQQIPPATPAAPSSLETGLRLERDAGATPLPSIPFEVKAIQITGNAQFDTPTLHALVADGEGKTLNRRNSRSWPIALRRTTSARVIHWRAPSFQCR